MVAGFQEPKDSKVEMHAFLCSDFQSHVTLPLPYLDEAVTKVLPGLKGSPWTPPRSGRIAIVYKEHVRGYLSGAAG